ncbi:MAG: hypothetical protein HYV29_12380 [Ignavibacteriales bacterium]|nr:hypothetical protein [Ignavibacteriales bacterium]
MTHESRNIVHQIRSRINETRQRLYKQELLQKSITAYSLIALIGGVLLLVESLAEFGTAIRTFIFYSYWITSAGIIVAFVGKPLLRFLGLLPKHSDEEIARIIGAKFEKVGDRLENALDLADMIQNGDMSSSPELIEVSLEHFQRTTLHINFGGAISFSAIKNGFRTIGAITAVIGIATVISGSPFSEAAERLWNYDKMYYSYIPFTIAVEPGDIDIIKGESVPVKARIIQNGIEPVPQLLTLSYAEEGISIDQRIELKPDSSGLFTYMFPSVKSSLQYEFTTDDISSERFGITVTDRPFVRSLSITIIPPAYSKLPSQTLDENIGDLLVLAGSKIIWHITTNKEISRGFVVYKDGAETRFKNRGKYYNAVHTAMQPTSYYIELEDTKGISASSGIEYKIDILPDAHPTVDILSPGKNVDVTQGMILPMEFKVTDDFGVNQLQLAFRLVQSRFAQIEETFAIILPFDSVNVIDEILSYEWDLALLGLVPEDVVEYFVEVFDNDNVNGPKSGRSQTFLIRLPSLEEVFADADKGHDDALKTMESALKDAEELKKEVEELSDDLKRNQNMDWQKEKKAEELTKKYQEIQNKIEEVRKQTEEMMENLQRNNAMSQETLDKYLELQKMMQELNSPEFQQAMKRMQQAMQNVSPEQMREAMQQAQFSEEQFRKSIDRTLNLLKRIQVEQKIDEAVKRAEEMQKEQEAIENETEQLKENDSEKAHDLARRQEEVNRQLEELQKSLNEAREKMEEFPKEMPLDKMDDAQRSADNKQMKEAMKQSAQNLRSLQTEQAMTSQQQASSGMQEMSEQISELQEQLLNNQMRETMDNLRKSMQDLLTISQQQEQLKNQSRALDPNSQQFRDIAQKQQSLQGDLSNVANALAELAQKSFVVSPEMGKQIGKAMGQMEQSMNAIEQRNGQMTSSMQGEAMASLNKTATLVQSAMQSMQQQGGQGGGSLMQQLRNMAMQQQNINMQTQQLGQQQGLSQQQMQEIGRLAQQQEAVRKSLEQLQREAQGNPERDRIMGDLNKITGEMKEVVEQLEQQNVDPTTLQQQERILSRLLQAQRSMRERDFEQRRTATAGVTPTRQSPLQLSQGKDSQLQRDLQRAMESGYSKEYIELIRKYYEAISKNN